MPLEKQWKASVCKSKTRLILMLLLILSPAFASEGRSYFKLLEVVQQQLSSLLCARARGSLRCRKWAEAQLTPLKPQDLLSSGPSCKFLRIL